MPRPTRITPRNRRRAGGQTADEVLATAKAIEGLEDHPGFQALMRAVDLRLDEAERRMVYTVKPLEHAEYAREAGVIQGLRQLKTATEQIRDDAADIEAYDRLMAEQMAHQAGEAGS